MKVFLAGATGAIGRPLVSQLLKAGHQVTGMTRSEAKAQEVKATGADAVVCNVYDAERLREVVSAAKPEVVINQLTDLPHEWNLRKIKEAYAGNDRIRREGTQNLVAAAVNSGARRIVAQSVAFLYAPEGSPIKDERAPIFLDAPDSFGPAVRACSYLEESVTTLDGIEGLALRYGFFYGPNTHYSADGYFAREFRRRRFPIVGKGAGIFSFIQIDDAAAAAVAALVSGSSGIYNIVDDEPAAGKDWIPTFAEAVGAKKPLRVPKLLARIVAGKYSAYIATKLRGASNAKAKRELGWQPRYPSWRTGFFEAL